ncbi:STM3941 family protein [Saccharicrinis sp. FJH54]|uniref:STM3941 family protein n=1 Tax=Saccharicrinis sp. FJH54 TaxID=3344665 RepID=UPI0035D514A6
MDATVSQKAIEYTRNRSWLFAFGSLVFAAAGVYLMLNAENLTQNGGTELTNTVIGGFMVLFFGYGMFLNIRRLIKRTPAYIFTGEGLVYNPKDPEPGIVPWREIRSFERTKVKGNYFILLMLKNPEAVIERERNGMKKRLMKMNMRAYKTPLSIAMNELQISVVGFESLLTQYLKPVSRP